MTARPASILVVAAVMLLQGCSGKLLLTQSIAVRQQDWPAFGRTAEHAHEASVNIRPPLELRWDYDLGAGAAGGSPILVDGIVFAGNLRGELHAIRLEDGKRLGWARLGEAVHGSPVFRNRTLIVPLTNTEQSLVAFDLSAGNTLWKGEYGEIEASLVQSNESVFFGNLAGEFFCVDAGNGSRRWKFSLPDNAALKGIRSTAAVGESLVVFGADDGRLYALETGTGHLRWRHTVGGALFAPVTLDSSRAFAASLQGTITAVDLDSGRPVWSFRAGTPIHGHILVTADLAIAATTSGDVIALQRSDGAVRWRTSTGAPLSAGLIRAGSYLYLGTLKKELIALAEEDGSIAWKTEVDGRVKTPPIADSATIIIVTDDKTILAFRSLTP